MSDGVSHTRFVKSKQASISVYQIVSSHTPSYTVATFLVFFEWFFEGGIMYVHTTRQPEIDGRVCYVMGEQLSQRCEQVVLIDCHVLD